MLEGNITFFFRPFELLISRLRSRLLAMLMTAFAQLLMDLVFARFSGNMTLKIGKLVRRPTLRRRWYFGNIKRCLMTLKRECLTL